MNQNNINQETDEWLASSVAGGDKNALRQLIEKYQPPMERYLLRLGIKNHDSEDVLQNLMLKMYLNINSFNSDKGKFSSWMYRIAHNEAITFIKKHHNLAITLEDDALWDIFEDDQDINISADKLKLKEAVTAAISKLSDKYRQPIILSYLEGKSYQEIGYILKIPVSTVGVRITRAKLKLKNDLKKWKGGI
jgi:RNA polymerase sigma-70 factor (ECF subfamily)